MTVLIASLGCAGRRARPGGGLQRHRRDADVRLPRRRQRPGVGVRRARRSCCIRWARRRGAGAGDRRSGRLSHGLSRREARRLRRDDASDGRFEAGRRGRERFPCRRREPDAHDGEATPDPPPHVTGPAPPDLPNREAWPFSRPPRRGLVIVGVMKDARRLQTRAAIAFVAIVGGHRRGLRCMHQLPAAERRELPQRRRLPDQLLRGAGVLEPAKHAERVELRGRERERRQRRRRFPRHGHGRNGLRVSLQARLLGRLRHGRPTCRD